MNLTIVIWRFSFRNLRRAQYQITTRNLGLIRNEMRKQQWINVLQNIEKLKKLVRSSFSPDIHFHIL